MRTPPNKSFEVDVKTFTIGAELANRLGNLIEIARAEFKPRNFAERHLVDDLAISKWRTLRVTLMEKAVFEHESGIPFEPHADMYHLATPRSATPSYSPPSDASIFAMGASSPPPCAS